MTNSVQVVTLRHYKCPPLLPSPRGEHPGPCASALAHLMPVAPLMLPPVVRQLPWEQKFSFHPQEVTVQSCTLLLTNGDFVTHCALALSLVVSQSDHLYTVSH